MNVPGHYLIIPFLIGALLSCSTDSEEENTDPYGEENTDSDSNFDIGETDDTSTTDTEEIDNCPNDPDKTDPGLCGCGSPETACSIECVEAIENEFVSLSCAENRTIGRIELASFGDYIGSCDGEEPSPGVCHSGTAELAIESACLKESSCQVDVTKDVLGDPDCPDGVKSHLIVKYLCHDEDTCPDDPDKTSPGRCGCGIADTDSDADGTADCNDECENDPDKITPQICGCGVPDTDSDGDGAPVCYDECEDDPNKTAPGECGCGQTELSCTCLDTPGYIDALGYYCSDWFEFDCNLAEEDWGYTEEEEQDVIENCPESCGLCP